MKPLIIAATTSTPSVRFDHETRELEVRGESYPENAFEFYKPILGWLRELFAHPQGASSRGPVVLRVHVRYMNTSSVKCMMDALDTFEDAHKSGTNVAVYWHYEHDNDRALDMAEDFKEELSLPFHVVAETRADALAETGAETPAAKASEKPTG